MTARWLLCASLDAQAREGNPPLGLMTTSMDQHHVFQVSSATALGSGFFVVYVAASIILEFPLFVQ